MAHKKIPVTYETTRPIHRRGQRPPVGLAVHRSKGSAQSCWLTVSGRLAEQVIFLDHATALQLWTELGPIVRDQRTERAVLEALVADDRAAGASR
jgi:hypothetical protein